MEDENLALKLEKVLDRHLKRKEKLARVEVEMH